MTSSSSRCGETQAEGYTDIRSAFYSDGKFEAVTLMPDQRSATIQ